MKKAKLPVNGHTFSKLWQLTSSNWAEINYSKNSASQVIENHYHKYTYELFFIVSGEVQVTISNLHTGVNTSFLVKSGDLFMIEPFELHTLKTLTNAKWMVLLSHMVDTRNPDLYTI